MAEWVPPKIDDVPDVTIVAEGDELAKLAHGLAWHLKFVPVCISVPVKGKVTVTLQCVGRL